MQAASVMNRKQKKKSSADIIKGRSKMRKSCFLYFIAALLSSSQFSLSFLLVPVRANTISYPSFP